MFQELHKYNIITQLMQIYVFLINENKFFEIKCYKSVIFLCYINYYPVFIEFLPKLCCFFLLQKSKLLYLQMKNMRENEFIKYYCATL